MSEYLLSGENAPEQWEQTGPSGWRVTKRTLRGGLSAGVEVIELDNGSLRVRVLPTRGMGLWDMHLDDWRIGWNAPAESPVHPAYVNLQARNGLGWLDGFNELLCRCGLSFNGPPGHDEGAASPIESEITLHGLIANRPADRVTLRVSEQGLHLSGVTREMTLFGPNLALETEYFLPFTGSSLKLTDTVHNLSSRPAEMQLLYHINVGEPLLEAGSRWQAPCAEVHSRDLRAAEGLESYQDYLPPTSGYAEQVYLCQLRGDQDDQTVALLTNAAGSQGFAVEFNLAQLPCFSVWKNTQAREDGYCTGLEPGTNYPNFKATEREHGRVVQLAPGERKQHSLTLSALHGEQSVKPVQERIERLTAEQAPRLHATQAGLMKGLS